MSKSVGNVVDPFQSRRPVWRRTDAAISLREVAVRPGRQLQPRGHRGALNADLANDLGNLGAALAVR